MRKDKRNIFPRWMNHAYADLFGYFWLPCSICKEFTGGHEWRTDLPHSAIMISEREVEGTYAQTVIRRQRSTILSIGDIHVRLELDKLML